MNQQLFLSKGYQTKDCLACFSLITQAKRRAIFNWMPNVFWSCIGFGLLRSLIGQKSSRHFLNQSNFKTKTNRNLLARVLISRAWHLFHVFASSSDWFIVLFASRLRLVSNFGDGDFGEGEIHTRARRVFSKFHARVCVFRPPHNCHHQN